MISQYIIFDFTKEVIILKKHFCAATWWMALIPIYTNLGRTTPSKLAIKVREPNAI